MYLSGKRNLRIRSQQFNARRLVIEACSGYIESSIFANGRTSLTGNGPVTRRRSIYTQLDGGAVLVTGNSQLTFRHCIFRNNSSCMCGCAVSLQCEPGSKITFEDCLFQHNTSDDTGPAIDLLTPGMRVEVKNCTFEHNKTTGALTSKPIGQISVFPGNKLKLMNCRFSDSDFDADYHEAWKKVMIAADRQYKIVDTTGMKNTNQLKKIHADLKALLAHPLHYPWV